MLDLGGSESNHTHTGIRRERMSASQWTQRRVPSRYDGGNVQSAEFREPFNTYNSLGGKMNILYSASL